MFEHKDYVEAIYKEKSFGKAAEKLHVSQPALSAMIKRLEKELGAPIFNRKTSPISLTSFGAEYLKSATIVTDLENRLKGMAYDENQLLSGELTLAAFSLGMPTFIAHKIAEFQKLYPNILIHLQNSNTLRGKQVIDSYGSDLLFSTKVMEQEKYTGIPIYSEQLVLVIPKDFAINKKLEKLKLKPDNLKEQLFTPTVKGVDLSLLMNVPFILASTENYIRTCCAALFQEFRVNPPLAMETEGSSICLNFARLGIGATICSHLLLENEQWTNQVNVYKIASPTALRTGFLYYRKGAYLTPAMEGFIKFMKK